MNYYGSPEQMASLRDYDERVFSHCSFLNPTDEYSPGDGYQVHCFRAVDNDELTRKPYRDLNTGLISRLYYKDELIFEWKFIGASPRNASIIHHANGRTYLLYYEDLYRQDMEAQQWLTECIENRSLYYVDPSGRTDSLSVRG